jgi:hypothetical protein
MGDRWGKNLDREGGGIGADDRVRPCARTDPAQHIVLYRWNLGNGLLDEVDAKNRVLDRVCNPEISLNRVGRTGLKKALRLELSGLPDQPLERLRGRVCRYVGERDGHAGGGKGLRDAAAHVAGADDGDGLDGPDHSSRPRLRGLLAMARTDVPPESRRSAAISRAKRPVTRCWTMPLRSCRSPTRRAAAIVYGLSKRRFRSC